MSETGAAEAKAAVQSASEAKTPVRPASEILADIERERDELGKSFESLRRDIDEAFDAGRERAERAGRQVAVIAPIAAAVLLVVGVAVLLFRRRPGKKG